MKLYLLNGTYYEKQADVPKGQGKFETVEFPFAASPKADFVAWMNERSDALPSTLHEELFDQGEELPVDRHVREQAAKPKPVAPQPRAPETVDGVMDWVFDKASNADIENLFTALGARFHEMRRAA